MNEGEIVVDANYGSIVEITIEGDLFKGRQGRVERYLPGGEYYGPYWIRFFDSDRGTWFFADQFKEVTNL
jgi:hypothetical protein